MKHFLRKTFFVVLALLTFSTAKADEGQDLFSTLCTPCHTIGKGRLVGPDLKNITEKRTDDWLVPYIQSSQTVIKSGDADAVAVFNEYNSLLMPDQPLDVSQTKAVISYIRATSSGNAVDLVQEETTDLLDNTNEDNVSEGLLLFSGEKRLTNGGPSCISCHKVKDDRIFSSGTLAKELSETYEIMGSAGVAAILKNPPFPVMGVTYKNTTLTEEEILNLTAYLRSVSENRIYQHPVEFGITFAVLGLLAFVFLMISIIVLYFKRKKESVNHEIHSRQSAVIN